jgi:hypothetical protein
MQTVHEKVYLSRNRNKKRYNFLTYEAMKNAACELAKKKGYKRNSFSMVVHIALYKYLRNNGFIN